MLPECCSTAGVSGNTLISHVYFLVTGCHPGSAFGAVQVLHGRGVGLCPAEFPQEAAGPKGAAVRWEGAGVQLTTGRDKQQLLEQAGLSLGFPFCHCKPLVRLSKNYLVSACARGLWCCRLSSSSQGAKCPRDPLQDWLCSGGQAGLKGRGEPCSASDTPSCEHHPRLQAEISSWPSGTGPAATPVLAAFCPSSLWHSCPDLPRTGWHCRVLGHALPSQGRSHLCWSVSSLLVQLSLAICMWDCKG